MDGLSDDEEKGNDTQEDKSVNENSRSNDDDDDKSKLISLDTSNYDDNETRGKGGGAEMIISY